MRHNQHVFFLLRITTYRSLLITATAQATHATSHKFTQLIELTQLFTTSIFSHVAAYPCLYKQTLSQLCLVQSKESNCLPWPNCDVRSNALPREERRHNITTYACAGHPCKYFICPTSWRDVKSHGDRILLSQKV